MTKTNPPTPPAAPEPIKLLLGAKASAILTEQSGNVFVVVHKVMQTERPEVNGRWGVSIFPCSMSQARAAIRVARGEARATKIKGVPQTY